MSFFRSRYVMVAVAITTATAFAYFDSRLGVFALVIFALVGLFSLHASVFPSVRRSAKPKLYERLLKRARGNKDLVERLIEYERKRSPDSDDVALLESALVRWEQDDR